MPVIDRSEAAVHTQSGPITAALLVCCACLIAATAPVAAELTETEARGKLIYTKGQSKSNRVIRASIGPAEAPSSATILPCVQCHGENGRGIGIVSPAIDWDTLTDPDGHQHPNRTHDPFDEASLVEAIARGVDPAGNDFEVTMPKYIMADEDMADLVAYLKVIGLEDDPAIVDGRIRIGTILPDGGQHARLGKAMRDTIEAVFSEVNAGGGVHGRELELVVSGWGGTADPEIWAAHDLVAKEPVMALVSPYIPNYDAELETIATERELPVVGPYTVLPPGDAGENRFSFYLLPGLALQAEALVEAAAVLAPPNEATIAIVHPRVRFFDEIAEAARLRAEALGFRSATVSVFEHGAFDGEKSAATMRESGADAVLFLGNAGELGELARSAETRDWHPYLLSPGILAERGIFELPASFSYRVLLSYPSLPTDYSMSGAEEFERLHEKYRFGYDHDIAQVSAYNAARVLVAGLENAGRRLNREELVLGLEEIDEFHPGLAPPISFGPFRRTGSMGAHIVRVDLAAGRFSPTTGWISLDESSDAEH
jgi:ABC-type branched-subunit amino acid transport system substrate-binding protein